MAPKGADSNAMDGLAVGESVDKMHEVIELVNEVLPKGKPHCLMDMGTSVNILEGVERGVDMFDYVIPARSRRSGMLFTKDGVIDVHNKK